MEGVRTTASSEAEGRMKVAASGYKAKKKKKLMTLVKRASRSY